MFSDKLVSNKTRMFIAITYGIPQIVKNCDSDTPGASCCFIKTNY